MEALTGYGTKSMMRKCLRLLGRTLLYGVLCGGGLLFVAPLLWMLSTSLKSPKQLYAWPPVWIPNPLEWINYPEAWQEFPFGTFYLNSFAVTGTCIVGGLLSITIVAYGFARLRFPGRDLAFFVLLSTMMLPGQVTIVPQYLLFAKLGWVNSFKPLIVPTWLASSPFLIFLLRQFFMSIPRELDDAARIDGCGYLGILRYVLLPLSKPALSLTSVFIFMGSWSDFQGPLIYIQSMRKFTVQIGLYLFQAPTHHDQAATMAMALIALIPQLAVFATAQRYLVKGVVVTGIKG